MFRFSKSIVFPIQSIFLFSFFFTCEAFTCPTKGKVAGSQVPLVTSLISGQTGYQTKIELVSGSGHLVIVEETFNQQNLFGQVKINDGAGHRQKVYWYHLETKESFFIDSDQSCSVNNLTDTIEKSIIDEWLPFNSLSDETDILSNPQVLGPVLLFTYMRIKSDNARYLGKTDLDGRQAFEWFYCVKDDGPYFDVFFDSNNNYPIRLIASYPDNPTLTTTLNVITFDPLTTQPDDLITYPYGYGCDRLLPASVLVPKFAQSDIFSLDMEAALFFTNPDRTAVTTSRIARYQGIYSYDLKENGISKRIVHDPKLLIDFQIDPISGTCVEGQASNGAGYGFTYMRWPYSENEIFNLLDDSILILDSGKLSYMGQIVTETGRLDVFEKKLISFFTLNDNGAKYDALITYFFPAAYDKRQSVRVQAPTKMIIKPLGELTEFSSETLVNNIEMNVIEYSETAIDFENRFDISGCFDEHGTYSWFQIVFSGKEKDILSYIGQDEDLKMSVRSALSFIPEIRVPEIQVSYIGSVVYITIKLLERPSYQYDFYNTPGFTVNNPTKIIQRDHEQDCGEVCSEDEYCTNFAYCNNLECRLFSSKSTIYPLIEESSDCDGFGRNDYFVSPKTEVEANFLKSSKRLIHEVKTRIAKGELNMKNPDLSALDLFIVSGPDQLGDPDTLFTDNDDDLTTVADHYKVLLSGRRLYEGNTILGLDYSSCLNECDNDDNCLVASFCSSRNGECILGNSVKNVSQESTILSEGCNILSRSYLSFFKKFPGRSLILDAQKILKNTNIEDCARACAQSSSQPCEAFDYCSEAGLIENQKSSSRINACFLHNFHISKDSANAIDGKVWDFSETKCDHYAKILSKDYKQLVGYKFDNNEESMILQTSEVSLENCAGSCTTTGNCKSFDYCESQSQSGMITSKCRLSSIKPDLQSSKSLESSIERCSIYVTNHVDPSKSSKSHSQAWIFISLSFFIFVVAFAIGLAAARHYYKR